MRALMCRSFLHNCCHHIIALQAVTGKCSFSVSVFIVPHLAILGNGPAKPGLVEVVGTM